MTSDCRALVTHFADDRQVFMTRIGRHVGEKLWHFRRNR